MAHSAASGHTLPATAPLQDWGCCRPPEPLGYSSSSPATSPDSCGLASPAAARGPCRGHATARLRGRKGARGAGGPGIPRQSASEREKLRMRRLAQALLRLRHYLPPALAPTGQTLTKIETLRLATRYIAHLSALLGLSQGSLGPRHCPLCPQGLGCCQNMDPPDALSPGAVGWGSPPMAGTPQELHASPGMGMGAWGLPPCGSAAGTPPEVLGGPDTALETWGSPPYIPVMKTLPDVPGSPNIRMETWGSPPYTPATGTPPEVLGVSDIGLETCGSPPYNPAVGTPPELHGAVTSTVSPWLTPLHCTGASASLDLHGDSLLDVGLVLPEFMGARTVTQDLSADLLSLLEALLPSQPQH